MELERERGISITSTVLCFEYHGYLLNLLDTPGHQDFSEDTYRTLVAADSAVMILDAAKGIEEQTKKLFQVCTARGIPILTFINKMDRLGRDPLDLLGEIESVLGIDAVPWNWPVGLGSEFGGVYDRERECVLLFEPAERGALQVPTRSVALADLHTSVPAAVAERCREDLELLDGAGLRFDRDRFLRGGMTPVFFGSAMTNFGIEMFLDAFPRLAPPPAARSGEHGPIPPEQTDFSGQVFKIQANLNPRHRDRIAFVRVNAGTFTPETEPVITRTGEKLRIKGSHRLFAQTRQEVSVAYPGDIVGLAITGKIRLGDTLCVGKPVRYQELPEFPPECFAVIRAQDHSRRKQMTEGLQQLGDEGVVQVFTDPKNLREPVLAAVGELQFDVVKFRLESEYNTKTGLHLLPYNAAAWVRGTPEALEAFSSVGVRQVLDHHGQVAVLAEDTWKINWLKLRHPELEFRILGEEFQRQGKTKPAR
jgi:peptide chain release factor 3